MESIKRLDYFVVAFELKPGETPKSIAERVNACIEEIRINPFVSSEQASLNMLFE